MNRRLRLSSVGEQRDFSSRCFLLLAIVAVTMRTFRDGEPRTLLEKDERLRQALGFVRVPHRTSIRRRMSALVADAEAQIAALGQVILDAVQPTADQSEVSAIDGRM